MAEKSKIYGHSKNETKIDDKIKKALSFVRKLFGNKKREVGNTRQIKYTKNRNLLVAALLHDCIEDAGISYDTLCKKFGKKVSDIVSAISQDIRLRKKKAKEEYIKRIGKASPSAQLVKIADMIDNLKSLERTRKNIDFYIELKRWNGKFKFSRKVIAHPLYSELKEHLKWQKTKKV